MELAELDPRPQALPPPPSRWRRARQPLTLAAVLGAGCAYVALVDPNSSSLFPQCPMKAMTGWDCPGCGMTRAVHALLHGNVGQAFDHNVLLMAALPLVLYVLVVWGARRMGWELPLFRWRGWMTAVGVIAVIAFGITRNLPQFSWLAAT